MAIPSPAISPLTLGTVQLGMDYGVSNSGGRPDDGAAAAILDVAWDGGLRCLDTARAYGDAEERIGGWMAARGRRPLIVTKVPGLRADGEEEVEVAIAASCRALGVSCLDIVMMHRATDLARPGVRRCLQRLQDEGVIGRLGASCYLPEQLEHLLADWPALAAVQVPLNLVNRDFSDSGVLDGCAERGVAVFTRSAFLQGLIFLAQDQQPPVLRSAAPAFAALRALADEARVPLESLALAGGRNHPAITSVVVGIAAPHQVADVLAWSGAVFDPALLDRALAICTDIDPLVGRPHLWPKS